MLSKQLLKSIYFKSFMDFIQCKQNVAVNVFVVFVQGIVLCILYVLLVQSRQVYQGFFTKGFCFSNFKARISSVLNKRCAIAFEKWRRFKDFIYKIIFSYLPFDDGLNDEFLEFQILDMEFQDS